MREPIHPGETLREDLDALRMSAAELARRIEVPVNRVTRILNDRRAGTGDTALRLGRSSAPRASSGSPSRSVRRQSLVGVPVRLASAAS